MRWPTCTKRWRVLSIATATAAAAAAVGVAAGEEQSWTVVCSKDCHGQNLCEQACSGEQVQTHACPKQEDCPVKLACPEGEEPQHCEFEEWSDWSTTTDCSGLCYRSREIAKPNRCGGRACDGPLQDSKSCEAPSSCKPASQDCKFDSWGEWSACNSKVQCQRERNRTLLTNAERGGLGCEGALAETEVCGDDCNEPADCVLSVWMEWSACSKTCGQGEETRLRTIVSRASHSGRPCRGALSESRGCDAGDCEGGEAQDCELAPWSGWTPCDSSDQQHRSRQIRKIPSGGGEACTGDLEQTRGCGDRAMAEEVCTPGDWTDWQLCDRTCGGGQTFRTRLLAGGSECAGLNKMLSTIETSACNTAPCSLDKESCRVSEWSAWSNCSSACGAGQQVRQREIVAEAAAGGAPCQLALRDTRGCPDPRPTCEQRDCKWSDWKDWGDCSISCGGFGQQLRYRYVSEPAFAGGADCDVQHAAETRSCEMPDCAEEEVCINGTWGDWSEWTICSKSCKGGFHWHSRRIDKQANYCGHPAIGDSIEEKPCNEDFPCQEDADCILSDWTEWSGCSSTCKGTQQRGREVVSSAAGSGSCSDGAQPLALSEVRGCVGSEDGTPACGDAPRQNCTFGVWSKWSECSVSCGGGQALRTRAAKGASDMAATLLTGRRLLAEETGDDIEAEEDAVPEDFHCQQGLDDIEAGWSTEKKEWCCINEGLACDYVADETFDCESNTDVVLLWSPKKKSYCCKKAKIGCEEVEKAETNDLCDGTLMQTRHCNTFECHRDVIDCEYADWSEWTRCSTCRGGERSRQRDVKTQAQNGGRTCRADATMEIEACQEVCGAPIYYCVWGDWSEDETCSTTCGSGVRQRIRQMTLSEDKPDDVWAVATDGSDCEGTLTELIPCENSEECSKYCVPEDCSFSAWSDWSSPTCDGLCMRVRDIEQKNNDCGKTCDGSLVSTKACESDCSSKDCKLSEWSGWTTCQSELDQSINTRTIIQMPTYNGMPCDAALKETRSCRTGDEASVDCTWSDWSSWGDCDVERQLQVKSRSISQEASNGGSPCEGAMRIAQPCKSDGNSKGEAEDSLNATSAAVNCTFSGWSEWSGCRGAKDLQVYRSRFVEQLPEGAGEPCAAPTLETAPCPEDFVMDVDCRFSDWSGWSACPVSCGGGQHSRSRSIVEHAKGLGKRCDGALLEATVCGDMKCPGGETERSECKTSEWEDWSSCSASCGVGYKTRRREMLEFAQIGTKNCKESLEETSQCEVMECPNSKDCRWSNWAEWSQCVPSPDVCGVGFKRRSRSVEQPPSGGGRPCEPLPMEQVMPVAQCQGQPECCVNGRWGDWKEWSSCSAECGQGTRKRVRSLAVQETWCGEPAPGAPQEYESCEAPGCGTNQDCEFAAWSEWSSCSSDCHGNRTRHREIKVHALGKGASCQGETEVVERCNPAIGEGEPLVCKTLEPPTVKTKQDCVLSEWYAWTPCSSSCRGGVHTRHRSVALPPQLGGKPCESSLKEVRSCNSEVSCFPGRQNCEWEEWQEWSACNSLRFQYRTRGMAQQQSGGGVACTGDVRDLRPCSLEGDGDEEISGGGRCFHQNYSCGWGFWSEWSDCSETCGSGGVKTRKRRMEVSAEPLEVSIEAFSVDALASELRAMQGQRWQSLGQAFVAGLLSIALLSVAVRAYRRHEDYTVLPQYA